jgi:mono/diheme cytochrome c family protein
MADHPLIKKIFIFSACLALTVLSASCQNKKSDKSAWPSSMLLMPQGLKQDQMPDPDSEGARLTASYCAQCHGIPYPAGHSASDWVVIMRKMMLFIRQSDYMGSQGGMMGGMRGGMRGGMMGGRNMPMGMMGARVPSQAEQNEILKYLQAHALKTIGENELPDQSGTLAEEFRSKCSVCHALPSPYQHDAEQWPAVVERMRKHMKDFHMAGLTDEQANSIVKYLQSASVKK